MSNYPEWPAFVDACVSRLGKGALEYQDKSFDLAPSRLLQEIQEELLDVVNWSYILWTRTRRLSRVMEGLDSVEKQEGLKSLEGALSGKVEFESSKVRFRAVVLKVTEKAIQYSIDLEAGPKDEWFAKAIIEPGSVTDKGSQGILILPDWKARERGLVA